jgi:hypothetical protein
VTCQSNHPNLVQQTNIITPVLECLYSDKHCFAFGKSTFKNALYNFAVHYKHVYQWFNELNILQFDGQKTVVLYNY